MISTNGLVFQFYRLPKVPTLFREITNANLKKRAFFKEIETLKLADSKYRLYKKEDVIDVLLLHKYAEMKYFKETRDCDDFSWSLVAHLKKLLPGICAGMIWVDVLKESGAIDYRHSLVVYVDYYGVVYYIEPQSNWIFNVTKKFRPDFAVI